MNTISLEDARYFLSQCSGILIEGRYVEPVVFDIEEDHANEWLVLQWEDNEGDQESIISVSFLEGDNQTILLEGSKMTLTAEDGVEEELTLLKEWKPNQS